MQAFTLKNGEQIFYKDVGSKDKTVVMLHGWTSSHEVYNAPVDLLKNKARFIIYDQRGHGQSKGANREAATIETLACDLKELIDGLHLSNVILLGWSMGAAVAMAYIRMFSDRALSRVILCDMSPKMVNDGQWGLGLYCGKYTKSDMEEDAAKDFLTLYCAFAIGAIPRLKRVPWLLLGPLLKRKLSFCDESVLKSLSASMKLQDNREVIGRITVPLTYFYADPGSLFSPELVYWYATHVSSGFTSSRFGNSTHMFISEHPREFAEELSKFL